MPAKKYILTIHEPCHEQWSQMTACGAGRYCGSCEKTIVDFTPLSDDSIVRMIENSNGKLCGRFQNKQLNRIVAQTETRPTFFSRMLKIAAGIILPAVFYPAITKAQESGTEQKAITQKDAIGLHGAEIEKPVQKEPGVNLKNEITGVVIDEETQEVLPFVSIQIEGSETGVFTDLDGQFLLKISDDMLKQEEITLTLSYIGYKRLSVSIKPSDLPLKKQFVLKMDGCVTMGVMVITKEIDLRPRLGGIPFVFK